MKAGTYPVKDIIFVINFCDTEETGSLDAIPTCCTRSSHRKSTGEYYKY